MGEFGCVYFLGSVAFMSNGDLVILVFVGFFLMNQKSLLFYIIVELISSFAKKIIVIVVRCAHFEISL